MSDTPPATSHSEAPGHSALEAEEIEQLDLALASLQDSGSDDFQAADASSTPSRAAIGTDDLRNMFYINFYPDASQLSGDAARKLEASKANINFHIGFLSVKSVMMTSDKVSNGKLPSDMRQESQIARGGYRAKVVDYLTRNCSWLSISGEKTLNKSFNCSKDQFHGMLVRTFTEETSLPDSIQLNLEALLNNIKSTIAATDKSRERRIFWFMITVYVFDEMRQQIVPYVRMIQLVVNDSLSTYTLNKDSSAASVNVSIVYTQSDARFNEQLFEGGIKQEIQQLLNGKEAEIINKPLDISFRR